MTIPYGRQNITVKDIEAVVQVLKSDYLTQGPKIPLFERAVCDNVDAKYAVATNSATSALHISCLSIGVGPGDYVWTSPLSFAASANCALLTGASVDFVDIDPLTRNICPNLLEEKLKDAFAKKKLPKALIAVHFSGEPCDLRAIQELSIKFGFSVIEDASHAIGAKYETSKVGSCAYSDVTVFSFHPVKIITTAEGGVATTNKSDLAKKMRLLRSHGITRDPSLMTTEPDGDWYYEQIELGFNYRLTDLQAALGLSQIQSLEDVIDRRNQIAQTYDKAFKYLPIITPFRDSKNVSAMHLYTIQLKPDAKSSRREVFDHLKMNDVGVNVHYIPIHLHPFYRKLGFKVGDFPNAENFYQNAITLPLFPQLQVADQELIIEKLSEVLC